jgi:uncharacterized protein YehS (DUF1456 family)
VKNNDILRKLRYTFNFGDDKMIDIFSKGGQICTRSEISDYLKKEDDEAHKPLNDRLLSIFLNGFIINFRGQKDGQIPEPEKSLNNNIIFRKIKIALKFTDEDILQCFELVNFKISKHELSAFFRSPEQSQYRECKDQFLRKFLDGLQAKYRPA